MNRILLIILYLLILCVVVFSFSYVIFLSLCCIQKIAQQEGKKIKESSDEQSRSSLLGGAVGAWISNSAEG